MVQANFPIHKLNENNKKRASQTIKINSKNQNNIQVHSHH